MGGLKGAGAGPQPLAISDKGGGMLGAADFAGRWQLQRKIEDFRAGSDAVLTGEAVLSDEGDVWRYHERGVLRMGDAPPMTTERVYLWRFLSARVEVSFEDGAPFHNFVPTAGAVATSHLCGDDLYRPHYALDHWPAWEVTWRVTGLRKDYVMKSTYSRV